LCQRPLGPADYIAVAEEFHTVILSDLPQLPRERHNEARRLSTLIDTLYDRQVRLVVSAATPPEAIYPEARAGFEFARTVSRLHQMCSQAYWQGHEAAGEGCEISSGAAPSRLAAGTHPG
jgi:cell division protein ZapE